MASACASSHNPAFDIPYLRTEVPPYPEQLPAVGGKGQGIPLFVDLLQCLFRRTVQLEYDEEHILIVQFLIGDAAESDVLVLHQKVFHIENRIKAVKQVIKNGKSSE